MKTIQELITFFEAIPAEDWCMYLYEIPGGEDENGKTHVQRCGLGHYNHHLCGVARPGLAEEGPVGAYGPCAIPMEGMGINPLDIIKSNNGNFGKVVGDNPKTRVLDFLRSKLKEAA